MQPYVKTMLSLATSHRCRGAPVAMDTGIDDDDDKEYERCVTGVARYRGVVGRET